ncbi:acetyl-CoA hydrolase/transferase family protein [Natranaerobius trueperi]|uniref:Acetyl-CoA hydrolase n=1 Tax=Natranaerobius trueperi TaxID=759412 RepID=A0A226C044_9FIRM|nr:acetyl-CoA hydrolase/transferase family protein [Natranaerobius trueperi]OWZ83819.1 acetyl-CoA hydrolase [Natranaerobius trueperi]
MGKEPLTKDRKEKTQPYYHLGAVTETERVLNKRLLDKITDPKTAAKLIENGMTVATSGFTPSGYPKEIPLALASRIKNDCEFSINLFTGASVGKELDSSLTKKNSISRRFPYQTNKEIRDKINQRRIHYEDIHLSQFTQEVRYGYFGNIDVAIIEAVKITPEGYIIPTTSVGATPTFCHLADNIIVEINTTKPLFLEGIHDIYLPNDPPDREPIPIMTPKDKIGTPYIKIDPNKIKAIVFSDKQDENIPFAPANQVSQDIAYHLISFLKKEVLQGRLPENLLPIQSGVGEVANAILKGLLDSPFKNLTLYSEVIQDSVLDLLDHRTIDFASSTSLTLSKEGFNKLYNNINKYKDQIVLRSQEISNHPEIIRRLGSIAINTAIEADIFGNVNSTNIMGTQMVNGIGGSGDFARNSSLSIFTTPSIAKDGHISTIVPMVSHVDHTEHDVKVIVTEQGLADLRGLSPIEKAESIIENCAHPSFKPQLRKYLTNGTKQVGHTPHILENALDWHINFLKSGSMKD